MRVSSGSSDRADATSKASFPISQDRSKTTPKAGDHWVSPGPQARFELLSKSCPESVP